MTKSNISLHYDASQREINFKQEYERIVIQFDNMKKLYEKKTSENEKYSKIVNEQKIQINELKDYIDRLMKEYHDSKNISFMQMQLGRKKTIPENDEKYSIEVK